MMLQTGCKRDPKECRINLGPMSVTAMYYRPIYDGTGRNINPDRNARSGLAWCSACDKKWVITGTAADGDTWTLDG